MIFLIFYVLLMHFIVLVIFLCFQAYFIHISSFVIIFLLSFVVLGLIKGFFTKIIASLLSILGDLPNAYLYNAFFMLMELISILWTLLMSQLLLICLDFISEFYAQYLVSIGQMNQLVVLAYLEFISFFSLFSLFSCFFMIFLMIPHFTPPTLLLVQVHLSLFGCFRVQLYYRCYGFV